LISYIKIYGPPINQAIIELEKIAIDMPEVCIMDYTIMKEIPQSSAKAFGGRKVEKIDPVPGIYRSYFMQRTGVEVPIERCHSIISEYGEKLGDYDFFFEWAEYPYKTRINELIERIDEALKPLGCLYTITNKR
jgi:hypothetical protein